MLMTLLHCQPREQSGQITTDTIQTAASTARLVAERPCGQTVWQAPNGNRYAYETDSSRRLSRCVAYERDGYGIDFETAQRLTYNPAGRLERVDEADAFSLYRYQNGQLTSIEFVREGQPIYRYAVTVNAQGLIVNLRGQPLNDSGLGAFSTQYTLDAQGRYVQLETRTGQGELFYRVVQRDFEPRSRNLYDQFRNIPFDLNRLPWVSWPEQFPMSRHLPRRVDVYRFATPETPTTLIKRSSRQITYRTNQYGYVTAFLNTDLLYEGRDTTRIQYQKCR
jgi:hypothetical protein